MKDALELVVIAEEEAFDQPDDRFEGIQSELKDPVYLDDVEQELELQNAVQNFPLSNEVRNECEQEMREGARTGWRLRAYTTQTPLTQSFNNDISRG